MKILFLGFVFLIITISAKAHEVKGVVKHFSGRSVESHHIYSYFALETEDLDRIILPGWLDSRLLSKLIGHELLVEGDLDELFCTDMSRACPTAEMTNIRLLEYQNESGVSSQTTYTGHMKRFSSYIALNAGQDIVEIPSFLYADKLIDLNPHVTLMGKTLVQESGPQKLTLLSLLRLEF